MEVQILNKRRWECDIGLNLSIVKTTLNTRENIKTEIYQQPKLIWPKACLEKKNFEKWKPSQRSAHICACFFRPQGATRLMGNLEAWKQKK